MGSFQRPWAPTLLLLVACGAEDAPAVRPATPSGPAPTATAVAPAPTPTSTPQCDERALTKALRGTGAIPRPVRSQVEVRDFACDDELAHATVVIADEPDGTSAFFRWNGDGWRVVDFGSDCSRPPPGVDPARCRSLVP